MTIADASGFSGTSVDNNFYYCDYNANSTGGITSVNWRCVDMTSLKVVSNLSQTTANGVCMDMTYDVTTSTLYGMSAMADAIVTFDLVTARLNMHSPHCLSILFLPTPRDSFTVYFLRPTARLPSILSTSLQAAL